jgi:hypothetical protein
MWEPIPLRRRPGAEVAYSFSVNSRELGSSREGEKFQYVLSRVQTVMDKNKSKQIGEE